MSRILIIDDDEDVRTFLRRALEKEGYTVDEASDGHEGIRSFCRQHQELIIVDLFMPHKEGIETILEIRERQPEVKSIAISGGGLTGDLELLTHAETFGAVRTFAKPLDLEEVLATVRELIGPAKKDGPCSGSDGVWPS